MLSGRAGARRVEPAGSRGRAGLAARVLTIDGSVGGGQVARVSLALAAATGTPVRVENVRATRPQPGLKTSHVAAVNAVAQLCDGEVDGATLGSQTVELRPGIVAGGEYAFTIETAGPVTLLLQAVLPAIAASRQRFVLRLRGGTNVAWSPQWDDFVHVHVPLLRRVGVEATPTLHRRGFFPQGGGEVTVEVETPALHHVDLREPGPLRALHAVVPSHGLPRHVMERAGISIQETFAPLRPVEVETDFHRGPGTGMAVALRAECAATVLGADAVGRKGVRVEDVVAQAATGLQAELRAGVGLDVHQTDQLLVFLAIAGGGAFTARQVTPHARAVLDLLPRFLPVRCETEALEGRVLVRVRRA